MNALLGLSVVLAVAAIVLASSMPVEKELECKPEIRIVYCYKQGDGFPDNCGE